MDEDNRRVQVMRFLVLEVLGWIARATALLVLAVYPVAAQSQLPVPAAPAADTAIDKETAESTVVAKDSADSPVSEYTGPALLSRENQPSIGPDSFATTFQPLFYVNQIYDTGLAVAAGGIGGPTEGVVGIESGIGLRGTHHWKRVILNVNYEGSFRQYTQQTGLNGLNQYLRATAQIQLKRHLELALRQTVASVAQDVGSLSLQPLDFSNTLPASEPFDNRARILDSQATLTFQKSQRLSFSTSMDDSHIERESAPLVGTDGLSLSGDVVYLLSRHATVGLDYNFAHYSYTTFGSSDLNTVSGVVSWRLTRTVDASMQVGISHGEVVALALVPLDPDVAALLGVTEGIQVSHQSFATPMIHGSISKHWHHASANVGYQRGISPGNGLILTSNSTSIDAGFHYTLSHTWALAVQAGRTSLQSLPGLISGSYAGYIADVSLTRSIGRNVQLLARFDARPFSYVGSGFQSRTFYRTTVGFIFSPRELPVVLR